jgi:hypothetical protein
MYQQSQRDGVLQEANPLSTVAIRKADTNSDFAIGYLYWTKTQTGLRV